MHGGGRRITSRGLWKTNSRALKKRSRSCSNGKWMDVDQVVDSYGEKFGKDEESN
jgi:hypothetical protein